MTEETLLALIKATQRQAQRDIGDHDRDPHRGGCGHGCLACKIDECSPAEVLGFFRKKHALVASTDLVAAVAEAAWREGYDRAERAFNEDGEAWEWPDGTLAELRSETLPALIARVREERAKSAPSEG